MSNDPFWQNIEAQLQRVRTEKPQTYAQIANIFPVGPGVLADAPAFFAGSGGDDQVIDALEDAGWVVGKFEAIYYYTATSPAGVTITYVEGDIYPGDRMTQ